VEECNAALFIPDCGLTTCEPIRIGGVSSATNPGGSGRLGVFGLNDGEGVVGFMVFPCFDVLSLF